MSKTLLIIISGAPGTGKTSLGKKIAQELHLPMVYKDGIKEMLFDTLGWKDKEWTEQLNSATFGVLYYFIEAQLQAHLSFIVEADFKPDEHSNKFLELKKKYNFASFQIMCEADDKVLLARVKERADSPDRHPGHKDKENMKDLKKALREDEYAPLDIGGHVIRVDTTDLDNINYEGVLKVLKEVVNS